MLFNSELATAVAALKALPDIEIEEFDVFQLFHDVVADKAAYGLDVVDVACLTPGDPPFACRNPDEYLFWDGLHPTRAGHAILADAVRDLLGL
jgi:phospholipase/lecithinase/hemolysin